MIMDWVSRAVLAWRLSNTLGAELCVEALEEALSRYGRPEIFNTDQGSQFTSDDFTGTLKRHAIMISMDGKGRYMDNIFVERLSRSLKYEEVYLNAYASVAEAKAGIGSWLSFYNEERQHQSLLGYRTPRQAYEAECRWICGRSASPSGCAFAHIPTGTTGNHRIDVDEAEGKGDVMTVAPRAIGAGTEIGRATP
jgi:putative transposase